MWCMSAIMIAGKRGHPSHGGTFAWLPQRASGVVSAALVGAMPGEIQMAAHSSPSLLMVEMSRRFAGVAVASVPCSQRRVDI